MGVRTAALWPSGFGLFKLNKALWITISRTNSRYVMCWYAQSPYNLFSRSGQGVINATRAKFQSL